MRCAGAGLRGLGSVVRIVPIERFRSLVAEDAGIVPLNDAIAAGGSTLRDFANAEGGQGYFQHAFDVYGREGQDCRRDPAHPVIRRIVQGGRSTFYCPTCQRR